MTEITWLKLHHDFADDPKFLRVSNGRKILNRRDCSAEWVRDRVSQPMSSTSHDPPLTVARPALSRKKPAHHGRTKGATK
jgi:hypothetical protein